MKYLKQFMIIMAVSFVGELLKTILPFPIPASIYGMLLMFVILVTGILKLEQVKDTAKFLVEIMPVMFIPAGVGLMASWGVLSPILVPVSVITVVALITVLGMTGRVSQWMIRREKKESEGKNHE